MNSLSRTSTLASNNAEGYTKNGRTIDNSPSLKKSKFKNINTKSREIKSFLDKESPINEYLPEHKSVIIADNGSINFKFNGTRKSVKPANTPKA